MTKRKSINNLKRIKLLLLDVDGVMTDGGMYYSESGVELKRFNVQDGYGIVKIVEKRAEELGITEVYQNVQDKGEVYRSIKKKFALKDEQIAYIGDDEFDVDVLKCVGFSAAPANALPVVKKHVQYICSCTGGNGAVREVIDLLFTMLR